MRFFDCFKRKQKAVCGDLVRSPAFYDIHSAIQSNNDANKNGVTNGKLKK